MDYNVSKNFKHLENIEKNANKNMLLILAAHNGVL